jgi:subtilisin family serine protease
MTLKTTMSIATLAFLLVAVAVMAGPVLTVSADEALPEATTPSTVQGAEIEPVLLDQLSDDSIDPSTTTVGLIVRLEGPTLLDLHRAAAAGAGKTTDALDGWDELEGIGGEIGLAPDLAAADEVLKASQAKPARAIEALGAEVQDSFQVILNGFLIETTLDNVPQIAQVEGVTSVRLAPEMKPQLGYVVPHIGATKVWDELGIDGTGAVVAVIDSGVDYTHAAFGGPGTPEDHANNDENIIEPGTFPTEKVIGGYDLAGHRYTPNCQPAPGVVCTGPRPDPDPLDPIVVETAPGPAGHGTHVSSIIAGLATETVHAGVAPGAKLVALKVFGNPIGVPASTRLSNSAMEWVVRNNLAVEAGDPSLAPPGAPPNTKIDVINLSLGSDWGTGMIEAEEAINAVIESGTTVVASAGNDGPFAYITGSPGTSELALSVSNVHSPNQLALAVESTYQDDEGEHVTYQMGVEGASTGENAWLPSLTLSGEIRSELAWYGMACNDATGHAPEPAQDLHGKVALIERGKCSFYDKIWNAQRFGAIAAVVFSDARPRTVMGCGPPSDCANGPGIPGVMVERADGLMLLDLVYEREIPVTVSLDGEREVDLVDTIAPSSSRGPSRHLGAIKPQISAPGKFIHAARSGSGNEGIDFMGTSMSGPVVTGVAALMWQRNYDEHLGLQPLDIAALAMNYSDPKIHITPPETDGVLAPIARQGSGLVNARRAATGMTVVRSQRGIAGLSFGNVHVSSQEGVVKRTKTLTVRNLSDQAKTYKPEWYFTRPEQDTGKGVELSFEPEVLTVDPHWTGELEVTLVLDPESMRKHWGLRGTSAVRDELAFIEQEIDGFVTITEIGGDGAPVADGDRVVVPFHSLPRDHSCLVLEGEDDFSLGGPDDAVAYTLTNDCNVDGAVEVFALGGSDPVDNDVPAKYDIVAAGMRAFEDASGNTVMEFAMHTRGHRRIAQDGDARVYLDLNQDTIWDRMVFSWDAVQALGTSNTEAFGRWFVQHLKPSGTGLPLAGSDLSQGGYFQPFDIDESITRLLVSADDPIMGLGLDFGSGDVKFNYAVRMIDRVGDFETVNGQPRHDDSPDGWTANGGPTFTFDQRAAECLTIVTEDGREMTPGRLAEFTIPANSSTTIEVRGCVAADGDLDTGLLFGFPDNEPGLDSTVVRRGTVVHNLPTIHMPYVSKNHRLVPSSGLVP